ncbi:hypothetical protein LR002_02775 [Candidatus Gracilibacteria bacterium]|nr:hypothetical protein [Candidatus Gracilibacteria bacterium]
MNKIEKKYSDFRNQIENLPKTHYIEEFDTYFQKYLLEKNIQLENFSSEKEFQNYIQDMLHFFKTIELGEKLTENLDVKYFSDISDIFHQKIDNLLSVGYKGDDIYEDFLKFEREEICNDCNQAISDILKNKIQNKK